MVWSDPNGLLCASGATPHIIFFLTVRPCYLPTFLAENYIGSCQEKSPGSWAQTCLKYLVVYSPINILQPLYIVVTLGNREELLYDTSPIHVINIIMTLGITFVSNFKKKFASFLLYSLSKYITIFTQVWWWRSRYCLCFAFVFGIEVFCIWGKSIYRSLFGSSCITSLISIFLLLCFQLVIILFCWNV